MASAQVSAPELEEGIKVEEEVHGDDVARESEVENLDLMQPMVEDKQDPYGVGDEVHKEDEECCEGITEVSTYVGARVISDDDDDDDDDDNELDAEGDGASDEVTIRHLQ